MGMLVARPKPAKDFGRMVHQAINYTVVEESSL